MDDRESIHRAAVDMTREIVTKAMADKDARIATLEAALWPFVRRQVIDAWAGHQGDAVFNLKTTLRDLRRAAAALGCGPTQAAGQNLASGQEGLVHGGSVAGDGAGVPKETP